MQLEQFRQKVDQSLHENITSNGWTSQALKQLINPVINIPVYIFEKGKLKKKKTDNLQVRHHKQWLKILTSAR